MKIESTEYEGERNRFIVKVCHPSGVLTFARRNPSGSESHTWWNTQSAIGENKFIETDKVLLDDRLEKLFQDHMNEKIDTAFEPQHITKHPKRAALQFEIELRDLVAKHMKGLSVLESAGALHLLATEIEISFIQNNK